MTKSTIGLSIPLLLLCHPMSVMAVEIELQPSISGTFVHILDSEISGIQLSQPIESGHQAFTLTPELQMLATGPVWNGSWSASHTKIKQFNDGFDDESYTDISLNNTFGFIKDRIVLFANANRNHRNVNQSYNLVSDPIFGQSEYIDVDTLTTGFTIQTSPVVDWRSALTVSNTDTDFDSEELENTGSNSVSLVKGSSQSAQLTMSYGQSEQQARVSVSVSGNRNNNDNRGLQQFVFANINVGFPVWRSLDLVVTGTKTSNKIDNSTLSDSQLDNQNYGVGVAWRFGARSYIELTQNKEIRNNSAGEGLVEEGDETQDETFTAWAIVFEPDNNNTLKYSNSRRFYGDSHSLEFKREAKRWNVSAKYSEDLTTTSRLRAESTSAGLFACPEADSLRDNCALLEGVPDVINPSLFYYNFADIEYFFEDELTLKKEGTVNVNYRHKKTTINVGYTHRTQDYLERESSENGSQTIQSLSASLNHRLSRRTSLNVTANQSETLNADDTLQRKGTQYSVGLERRMTRKATGTLSLKRYESETNSNTQAREDNRVELTYTYKF